MGLMAASGLPHILKVGDTTQDILEGFRAGCAASVGWGC